MISRYQSLIPLIVVLACISVVLIAQSQPSSTTAIPRLTDGKPNLQGIWQVHNRAAYDLEDHHARLGMPAGASVVEGGTIPY